MPGIVCRKDTGVSLRVKCIVRSATLKCLTSEAILTQEKTLKSHRKPSAKRGMNQLPTPLRCHDQRSYLVYVQGGLLEVPEAFFDHMPSLPRQSIIQPPGVGASRDKPIYLRGPTITQFRHLLYASTVYPAIDLNSLSLEQVLSIAEWAFNFGLTHLKTWSQKAMSSLFIPAANSPLRTASNDIFFRALRLASLYRLPEVSSAVQVKWITRILWHELSPVPAIILADRCDFRSLLSHAYYIHMVELGVRLTESNFISDPSSILTRKHRTHLLAGYHSLSAYWKHLRISPPPFEQAPQCKLHRQCCAAWKMRWSVACSRPCSIPEMDVLRRLRFVEDLLKEDMLVEVCLASGCRALALDSISKKRTDISNNLHHHFDLA